LQTIWTPRAKFSCSFCRAAAREVPGLDITAAYVPARELGGDFYDFCHTAKAG